jgi:pyruvate,water dikinase
MREIVWLGESFAADPAVAGGKAAALSALAASHRVPPGFVVTTAAYGRGQAAIEAQLAAAYEHLATLAGGVEPPVAVRSSAADEDGALSSFAGVHESYLNVCGLEDVIEAVLRCWESVGSERALEYRRNRGLTLDAPLAVLVQQLVPADVSAVAFTANPITGSRDEIVLTASYGLGESIVGGTVTPDTYVLTKRELEIISRTIGAKERMTVPVPGGTRETAVPVMLRDRPALTDEQACELAGLALALEREAGWPVDVEAAFRGEVLYLLQSRPITTLAMDTPNKGDDK